MFNVVQFPLSIYRMFMTRNIERIKSENMYEVVWLRNLFEIRNRNYENFRDNHYLNFVWIDCFRNFRISDFRNKLLKFSPSVLDQNRKSQALQNANLFNNFPSSSANLCTRPKTVALRVSISSNLTYNI